MKLDPLFTSHDNSLFFLDGKPLAVLGCPVVSGADCVLPAMPQKDATVCLVQVEWPLIGLDEESYNEEFLAVLRDWLKKLEEEGRFAILLPVSGADKKKAEPVEAFCESVKHLARRVKDCASVAGVCIPDGWTYDEAKYFMEALSKKHAQYVYFSQDSAILSKDGAIVKY